MHRDDDRWEATSRGQLANYDNTSCGGFHVRFGICDRLGLAWLNGDAVQNFQGESRKLW